ncbi:MAG: hypothetical protein OSJ74_10525, partial [Clostridia bacterium]|nr:hypothetical protein [Clostridia bacterium]
TIIPTSMKVLYTGKEFDLKNIYSTEVAGGLMTINKKEASKNYTDVGKYTFDITLNSSADDYVIDGTTEKRAVVTVEIIPAKISIMGTIPVTEYGVL